MTASLAKLRQVALSAAHAHGIDGADAEDVAQDALERYVRTPVATGGVSFTWVTAKNRAISLHRRRRVAEERLPALVPPQPPGPAETVLDLLERSRVRAAVRDLPLRQRQVTVMRACGFSEKEVTAMLGISPGAVKSHAARAKAALRAALEEQR